jgi:5'-3' exonuclease
MGIPSYYKKLSEKIKGLVSKSRPGNITSLFFDFNCLIYHCARRPNSTLPPYPGEDRKEEWEDLLIEDIAKYVQHVWHEAGQPPHVFLSIDGVVPMAKIKQQRLRRFKSIWLHQQESTGEPTWDTNCITPSTAFMKRLSKRLDRLSKGHKGWELSNDYQPGEGEHKIMHYLRTHPDIKGPLFVYGLDADLILLTMLNSPVETYLMREDSEMGVVELNILGEESFSYFSLEVLKETLWHGKKVEYMDVLEYVTAMSLLGNDFIPHSLSVKIRDDGHKFLVNELKTLLESGQRFVTKDGNFWKINYKAVEWLFKRWSAVEEDKLLHSFKRKIQMRGNTQITLESLPLQSPVEFEVVKAENREWSLKQGWETVYREKWLFCHDVEDLERCCREYLMGLQWVLDYYTGQKQVDMTWFYPRLIPPLWRDLHMYLELGKPVPEPKESSVAPIQPEEQLAMVLPLESWHHISTSSPLRSIPGKYPQYWPSKFDLFTPGRVWTWESEPMLPVLPVQMLR